MPEQVPKFYKNPALATILSFFFSGLGQIYNGEIGKGIVFIVLYGISIGLMLIVIGFVTTPILWIWGMVDANTSAKRINQHLASQ
jgi:TM2 domain-containing membrane protein YozV